jgi:tetratricopeptide (TPR) repeat protein
MGLIFMGLAVAGKSNTLSRLPLEEDGLAARVARACYSIWFYLAKTAIPRDIAAFYPLTPRVDWRSPAIGLSIAATLAVSVGLILLRRRWPGPLAAWVSYLVLLAPTPGLVRVGNQAAADRYSYLALLGLVVLLAAGLGRLAASLRPARAGAVALAAAALVPVLALAPLARTQCRAWHDSEALWAQALAHGGPSGTAHHGLGMACYRRSRYPEAMHHYAEAIRYNPAYIEAYNDLAMILATCPDARYRDGARAVELATRACELTAWGEPVLLDTLAAACAEAGDFGAAAHWQEKAMGMLAFEPDKGRYRTRLELYRARKPYRLSPAPPPGAGGGP